MVIWYKNIINMRFMQGKDSVFVCKNDSDPEAGFTSFTKKTVVKLAWICLTVWLHQRFLC